MDHKYHREGFSLIEMIIAIAIVGIVMSSVVLLISYSTNSMRRTTNSVNLQNETKDALLHITTYLQEGSEASWDSTTNSLYVAKEMLDLEDSPVLMEVSRYQYRPESTDEDGTVRGSIYFNKISISDADMAVVHPAGASFNFDIVKPLLDSSGGGGAVSGGGGSVVSDPALFVKNVIGFDCELVDNVIAGPVTGDSVTIGGKNVIVKLHMKNENGDAEFSSTKEVFMRNS